ncbi:MAG: Trm112 family protein [Thermomicrobiales bacterium]|nr:Trm112 family protein [Thermomicrobiales bacterium]
MTDVDPNNVAADGDTIAPDLLAILVCPVDKAPLRQEPGTLICTKCGRQYPVEDGIPNMLTSDTA